ncbi:MAG: SYNERG-CTERM sorting domain-containing protein, partial [Synergistaceae bacterium]|nr:SYNERG-CTERM sorting domain-containing protein [Synergistaceae bacterium]
IALGGETIEAKTYLFIISIKDDGVYDWDETPGSIYDPVIMGVRERSEPSGGSGGCAAGASMLAALAAAALIMRGKRK